MTRRFSVVCIVFLLLACLATSGVAQLHNMQFSGDMKITSKQMSSSGKFYMQGQKVRMEMDTPQGRVITIADPGRKVVDTIMVDRHMYMEMSTDSPMAQQKLAQFKNYDPAKPCANDPDLSCEKLGPGTADGRACDKWKITHLKTGRVATEWIDRKTGMRLRVESNDGSVWELLNFKEGPQEASLFEVPAGYQKFDMNNMMQGMQGMQGGKKQ